MCALANEMKPVPLGRNVRNNIFKNIRPRHQKCRRDSVPEVMTTYIPSLGSGHNWCLFSQRLPGRLNVEQTAQIIGCQPHDIAAVVRAKLLRPLGSPTQNAVKYFSSAKLVESCADERWLDRVTKAISQSRKGPGRDICETGAEEECKPARN